MSGSSTAPATTVRAAGAICWRRDDGQLRVLLVHRPRYDDWSWPKGKLDAGEPVAVAAVREVAEETGLQVRLGVPLPTARYRLSDVADKQVAYWAAHVSAGPLPTPPRPTEVDGVEWVTPDDAAQRLTRRGDRQQLQALLDAETGGALDTFPFMVVRHGLAHPRESWSGADDERPLAEAGERQAALLADLLAVWGPEHVYSSPSRRCTDSVRPYVQATDAKLTTTSGLSERGHRRDPRTVSSLVAELLAEGRPVGLCTHRPVLGSVLGTIAGHAAAAMADEIPSKDPFLDAGGVLVAHVGRRSGRVVAVERHAVLGG